MIRVCSNVLRIRSGTRSFPRLQPFSSVSRTTDGFSWSTLYDEAHQMTMAAYLSYPFTFIMREAKRGNIREPKELVDKLNYIHDGDLNTALTPAEMLEIVQSNIDFIKEHYVETASTNNATATTDEDSAPEYDNNLAWVQVLEGYRDMAGDDADRISFLEFDDHADDHRLVYAISVNKITKRITIVFRGTYAEDTDDWKRNLQFGRTEVELPESLRSCSSSAGDDNNNINIDDDKDHNTINLHRGCYEYLFQNEHRDPSYTKERYDEILDCILEAIELYPDFKVFVTGHSLGGALGLLLSFHIAADARIPKPVTCVSVGALLVGDVKFQRAFSLLERRGWIRHLRITNADDPVPSLPPFPWFKPVGMHLELFRDGGHSISHPAAMEQQYTTQQPAPNTWGRLWETVRGSNSFGEIVYPHMLHEYLRRLERERTILKKSSLNDCYRDSQYVGDLESSL